MRTTKKAGLTVVLATSALEAEAEHLTAALGADDVIDVVTTKDDVDTSKPDPGAVAVYRDVRHLLDDFDGSPLGSLRK